MISVSKAVEQGYKFGIDIPGLIMDSKSTGDNILLPPAGGMYHSYGRRVADCELARAVITSGLLPTTDVDINHYHRTTANTHPRLLRESAKQQGVKLKHGVKLLPCVGCSAAKEFSAPVKTTQSRSDRRHGGVFVDT